MKKGKQGLSDLLVPYSTGTDFLRDLHHLPDVHLSGKIASIMDKMRYVISGKGEK